MAPNTTGVVQQTGGLPVSVVGPIDLGRMIRELEQLNDMLGQQRLRGDTESASAVKTSKLLGATIELNKIDFTDEAQRKKLHQFLVEVRKQAPVLHMSFSADPPPAIVEKIIIWLRREIDQMVLLTIGMQPNIGAGCVLRTTNHYFDFSLRKDFETKESLFLQALKEAQ